MRKQAPLCWFNKSSDLRASAGALWMSMHKDKSDVLVEELGLGTQFSMSVAVWPVYMMICGMSLELLFKAISLSKGNQVKTNHNLVEHADLAGVKIDKQSKDVLALLTESIIWEGKYPVPKDKGKESFYTAQKLYNDVMYTKGQFQGFECKKPTDTLSWVSFNDLWLETSKEFWANHK